MEFSNHLSLVAGEDRDTQGQSGVTRSNLPSPTAVWCSFTPHPYHPENRSTVTAYLESNQLLLYVFARQCKDIQQ